VLRLTEWFFVSDFGVVFLVLLVFVLGWLIYYKNFPFCVTRGVYDE